MDAIMPQGMNDFFAEKMLRKSVKNNVSMKKRASKKSAKKLQARKNKTSEINEFLWLKKHLSAKFIFTIFIISIAIMTPYYLAESDIMPIEKIRMQGAFKQLDIAAVKSQLESYLGQGFFSVDIQSLQQKIHQQPWIKSVSIQRVWPGELSVTIHEKKALARWDKRHLLSSNGVVFEAAGKDFDSLPLVTGFIGESASLLQQFQQLQSRFSVLGLTISELRKDRKDALFLKLNNHLLLRFGSDNIELKIKHFLSVYPVVIQPNLAAIKAIDFRYSNGFAIAWKDGAQPVQEKPKKRSRKHV